MFKWPPHRGPFSYCALQTVDLVEQPVGSLETFHLWDTLLIKSRHQIGLQCSKCPHMSEDEIRFLNKHPAQRVRQKSHQINVPGLLSN